MRALARSHLCTLQLQAGFSSILQSRSRHPIRYLGSGTAPACVPRVAVVGGGPGGAVAALCLAREGVEVTVFEAAPPRTKSGEGLAPNCRPLLQRLGLEHVVDDCSAHRQSAGIKSAWGSAEPIDQDFLYGLHGMGVHLDRLQFEADLAREARKSGAVWRSSCTVNGLERTSGDSSGPQTWSVHSSVGGSEAASDHEVDFVLLCTGRNYPAWAEQLTDGTINYDLLTGVSRVVTPGIPVDDTFLVVEADANGWWYSAPLGNDRVMVTYMTDWDLLKERRRENPMSPLITYTDVPLLTAERLAWDRDNQAESPVVRRCGVGCANRVWGGDWLAVGDAAASYDPLSSYGITSAMGSGYYAARAVLDHFAGEADALSAYGYIMAKTFAMTTALTKDAYDVEQRFETEFWRRRHADDWPFGDDL